METIKYYFVLGDEDFLLKQEPLEEILRERVQNYNKKNKLLNFWIVKNPDFLKRSEFLQMSSVLSKNNVAIISTEKVFITWLKLRLNNVLIGNFDKLKQQDISPLKSTQDI